MADRLPSYQWNGTCTHQSGSIARACQPHNNSGAKRLNKVSLSTYTLLQPMQAPAAMPNSEHLQLIRGFASDGFPRSSHLLQSSPDLGD